MPAKKDPVTGNIVFFGFPWMTNPNYHAEMMAKGKGPSVWHRNNAWTMEFEQLGNITFKVGNKTQGFAIPNHKSQEERKRVFMWDKMIRDRKYALRLQNVIANGLPKEPDKRYGKKKNRAVGS